MTSGEPIIGFELRLYIYCLPTINLSMPKHTIVQGSPKM